MINPKIGKLALITNHSSKKNDSLNLNEALEFICKREESSHNNSSADYKSARPMDNL